MYLDSGFNEAKRIIQNAFADRLVKIPDSAERRDPKTRLQELVQSRKIALPDYQVEKIEGKAHEQTFSVRCTIGKLDASTTGQGSTRRDAEQESAEQMLALLETAD